jgi:predicted neutral ceramidase superfamily lipid hydrolase
LLQGGTEIAVIAASVIIGLLVLWIIVSIPVWIAAKILTRGRVKFSRAMLVTALGPIIYAIVFFLFAALLTAIVGDSTVPIITGFIVAFIAWIGVFKKGFDTGWLRALGIAILAIIVFAVIGLIISFLIQLIVPEAPPITPIPPIPLQQV